MSRRTERVNERIRQELAEAIPHLKHPEIGFVTITGVDVSPDLTVADVQVSVLPTREHDKPERSMHALEQSRGFLQSKVGDALKTRETPELRFHLDESAARAARVGNLIRQARDSDPDHQAPGQEGPGGAGPAAEGAPEEG
jgi:ribosome-binding factor A